MDNRRYINDLQIDFLKEKSHLQGYESDLSNDIVGDTFKNSKTLGNEQNPQEDGNNEEESKYLPPPNPILDKRYQDQLNKDQLKFVFKKLPSLQQKMKFFVQDSDNDDDNSFERRLAKQAMSFPVSDDDSLFGYFKKHNFQLVYQKFDNTKYNSIPYNKQRFFSGLFVNIKKLFKESVGIIDKQDYEKLKQRSKSQTYDLNQYCNIQNTIFNMIYKLQLGQTITKMIDLPLDSDNHVTSSSPLKKRKNEKHDAPIEPISTLQFDSKFESGNLFSAYKQNDREYDLVLQNDINSKGNTQWFYFSVENTTKNSIVKFNIVNLMKNDSLFNYGMRPVVMSRKKLEKTGDEWTRGCSNIESGGTSYYTLSFSYKFEYSHDKVYFAHCLPYTYTKLVEYLAKVDLDVRITKFYNRNKLCSTMGRLPCELLTVTQNINEDENKQNKKKYIIIMARQHPGETPGSFIMEGVLDFLLDPYNEDAKFLRQNYIFKIIPMVNPDGVVHGNYRCGLSGVDLNRQWENPSKEYHATVYWTRNLIEQLDAEKKEIRMILDLHGHSKKMNSFFYGNPDEEDSNIPKLFPQLCSQINADINFKNCAFKLSADKQCTMRQSLYEYLQNPYIYTFEASFFGSTRTINEKKHFSVQDFKNLGISICKAMYKQFNKEISHIGLKLEDKQLPKLSSASIPNIQSTIYLINEDQNQNIHLQKKDEEVLNFPKPPLITQNEHLQPTDEQSFGSDSDPSEDELTRKEMKSLIVQNRKKKSMQDALNIPNGILEEQDNMAQTDNKNDPYYQQAINDVEHGMNNYATSQSFKQSLNSTKSINTFKACEDKNIQTNNDFDYSMLDQLIQSESLLCQKPNIRDNSQQNGPPYVRPKSNQKVSTPLPQIQQNGNSSINQNGSKYYDNQSIYLDNQRSLFANHQLRAEYMSSLQKSQKFHQNQQKNNEKCQNIQEITNQIKQRGKKKTSFQNIESKNINIIEESDIKISEKKTYGDCSSQTIISFTPEFVTDSQKIFKIKKVKSNREYEELVNINMNDKKNKSVDKQGQQTFNQKMYQQQQQLQNNITSHIQREITKKHYKHNITHSKYNQSDIYQNLNITPKQQVSKNPQILQYIQQKQQQLALQDNSLYNSLKISKIQVNTQSKVKPLYDAYQTHVKFPITQPTQPCLSPRSKEDQILFNSKICQKELEMMEDKMILMINQGVKQYNNIKNTVSDRSKSNINNKSFKGNHVNGSTIQQQQNPDIFTLNQEQYIAETKQKNQASFTIKHQTNNRHVRKLYSVPFHKKFIEKLLSQQQQIQQFNEQ